MKNTTIVNMQMPIDIGRLHFVGIGGIGMSGIAEILLNLGYKVSGSDLTVNPSIDRLKKLGAEIYPSQIKQNVIGASAVIISTAIKEDNPEYIASLENRIPIVHRSEMLAEIMRLKLSIAIGGTHGKTTTTSLVAHALMKSDIQPTIINGGILNSIGTNAHLGMGKWLVAEADESDGTFTRLPLTIAVVTNMDPEHLDYYGDFEAIKEAFYTFVNNVPFYGCAIICIDHPDVQKLGLQISNRRSLTYGLNPQADVRAVNVETSAKGTTFDVIINDNENINGVFIPLFGKHNIQNSLAAIAVCLEVGVHMKNMKNLFKDFKGVKRRFTKTGNFNGALTIDDYAHHPVEIRAVLQACTSATNGKVIAVMQPHRFTRLKSLFEDFSTCFNDATQVYITPVYSAGEQAIEGIDNVSLAQNITLSGHHLAKSVSNIDELTKMLKLQVGKGDVIIFLGAGDITKWAYSFPTHPISEAS